VNVRRSTFTDQSVTYGAVGGTQAPDLLYYPPKGFKPVERQVRLGSGAERFTSSVRSLMTWGVQRGSRIDVTDVQVGTGEQYAGVRYNPDGTPAALREQHGEEAVFDEDGTPYIVNGMTAVLKGRVGIIPFTAPLRVVYVVDEAGQAGFACGTLPGHPLRGEEAFIVEHRADDSVWLIIRAFFQPANGWMRLGAPVLRWSRRRLERRYLRALHPANA
jgi:uncharacterized protein (UPF0548 family)